MNILKKITKKDLFLNKKRTLGILIGITLASFLITIVSSLFITFQSSILKTSINETGYYHIKLLNLTKDDIKGIELNKDFSKKIIVGNLGYYDANKNDCIYSMDKATFDYLHIKLIEGTFPKNSHEILISKDDTNLNIGDNINLSVGNSIVDNNGNPLSQYYIGQKYLANIYEYNFKIVGFLENNRNAYVTTNIETSSYNAYLALKKPYHYQKDFSELLDISFNSYDNEGTKHFNGTRYDYEINNNIMTWEVFGYSIDLKILYSLLLIISLIILIISVFSIRNSFAISAVEKTRIYAMLRSVGTTKKQISKMILLEGLYLGLIASPIGIILGIIFSFILTKVINYIIINYIIDYSLVLYYKLSIYSIIISILFNIIMIYISTYLIAKRTSNISPIENIRNEREINSKKRLKVPKIVSKIFKIGGIISYKNLKLNKRKFRVTVISLTISILSFITFSSFVQYSFKEIKSELPDLDYNITVSLNELSNIQIKEISKLDKNRINYYLPNKSGIYILPNNHILYNNLIKEACLSYENDICLENKEVVHVNLKIIDDISFREYVSAIKANYEEIKDKAIVINDIKSLVSTRPEKYAYYTLTNYEKNDELSLKFKTNDNSVDEFKIKVGSVTNIRKYEAKGNYYEELIVYVNEKYINKNVKPEVMIFNAKNSSKLEKEIKYIVPNAYIENTDREVKSMKASILIISIIIYGFIGTVTFIGLSSVFNTISSNMELRKKEFAMLKAIGMTKKEFNNMILLEAVFYSFKSLFYGIILGLLGTFIIYKIFAQRVNYGFIIPVKAIIISIIFIIVVIYTIMKYSLGKVNKQNIIETIRNENI